MNACILVIYLWHQQLNTFHGTAWLFSRKINKPIMSKINIHTWIWVKYAPSTTYICSSLLRCNIITEMDLYRWLIWNAVYRQKHACRMNSIRWKKLHLLGFHSLRVKLRNQKYILHEEMKPTFWTIKVFDIMKMTYTKTGPSIPISIHPSTVWSLW